MNYKFNKNQINLLNALSPYYNIIVITDRFGVFEPDVYHAQDYVYGSERNPYLTLRSYKRITDIISENSIYVNNENSLGVIRTQIDGSLQLITTLREFDKNQFSWIKF